MRSQVLSFAILVFLIPQDSALQGGAAHPALVGVENGEAVVESGATLFEVVETIAPIAKRHVVDVRGGDRARLRSSAISIQLSEVDAYAKSAHLVSVVFPIRNLTTRELSVTLRHHFPDSQLETVSNIGNENQLLIVGFGLPVAQITKMLKGLDVPPCEEPLAARVTMESAGFRALEKRVAALEREVEALK